MSRYTIIEPIMEGMPEASFAPVQPGAKNALARALRPEYVGINPLDYLDITEQMLDAADPNLLGASLMDRPRDAHFTVGYIPGDTQKLTFVALPPPVFKLISGSIWNLSERAMGRTVAKRATELHFDIHEEKAKQDAHNATTNVRDKAKHYVDTGLAQKIALVKQFKEAAKHPGLARFSDEADMRQELTNLRTFVIDDMLRTIRFQRGWNDSQERLARRSIEYRMFLDRNNNQHIAYFRSFIDMADQYYGHQWAVFMTKIEKVNKHLKHDA